MLARRWTHEAITVRLWDYERVMAASWVEKNVRGLPTSGILQASRITTIGGSEPLLDSASECFGEQLVYPPPPDCALPASELEARFQPTAGRQYSNVEGSANKWHGHRFHIRTPVWWKTRFQKLVIPALDVRTRKMPPGPVDDRI